MSHVHPYFSIISTTNSRGSKKLGPQNTFALNAGSRPSGRFGEKMKESALHHFLLKTLPNDNIMSDLSILGCLKMLSLGAHWTQISHLMHEQISSKFRFKTISEKFTSNDDLRLCVLLYDFDEKYPRLNKNRDPRTHLR